MLQFIRNILAAREEKWAKRQEMAGYSYAVNRLLTDGCLAISKLENEVDCSIAFDDYRPFDKGIERAIQEFRQHFRIRAVT